LIGLFLQIQSTPSNDCPIQQTWLKLNS
jgi:hypothetical protein